MSLNFKLPTAVALGLGLVAGVAQVVNEAVLSLTPQVHAGLAVLIVGIAGMGVGPIVGDKFRSGLHLPGWAYAVITGALGALVLAVATLSLSTPAHAVLAVALTVAAALGFEPSVQVPVAPKPVAKAKLAAKPAAKAASPTPKSP